MFKPGDWVWGIEECKGGKYLTHALIIARAENLYICVEQIIGEYKLKNVIESIYERYKYDGNLRYSNILLLKEENTFATEQEAREALEVMK